MFVANSPDEASHSPTGNQPLRDFLSGAVAKNPPANVGDTGSILGHGTGSLMPQGNQACALQMESPCMPQLLSPQITTREAHAPRERAHALK